ARYASSLKLAKSPAPDSTATLNPSFWSWATTSGVVATRRSPSWISLGTPIFIRPLPLWKKQRDSIDGYVRYDGYDRYVGYDRYDVYDRYVGSIPPSARSADRRTRRDGRGQTLPQVSRRRVRR